MTHKIVEGIRKGRDAWCQKHGKWSQECQRAHLASSILTGAVVGGGIGIAAGRPKLAVLLALVGGLAGAMFPKFTEPEDLKPVAELTHALR